MPAGAPARIADTWIKVLAEDTARGQVVREAFMGPPRTRRAGITRTLLLHVPRHAHRLALDVITLGKPGSPVVSLRVFTRRLAALHLLAAGWRTLPGCLWGAPAGLPGRIRTVLGQAPARQGDTPPYAAWQRLYEVWGDPERQALSHAAPPIEVVLTGPDHRAALSSLAVQWRQAARTAPLETEAATRPSGAWRLLLPGTAQLPPHALACFAHAAANAGEMRAFVADADILDGAARRDPLFKPNADPWLRATGLLTAGACLFHPDVALPPAHAPAPALTMAESLPAAAIGRIPFILTHLPPGWPAPRPPPESPPAAAWPAVSIIIPSAGRSGHVLRCLKRILDTTSYPNIEILIAVSSLDPDDRRQCAILRRAAALPGVRVLDLALPAFNYAVVNNLAARQATGDLLLLLNDDVVPADPSWLCRLAVPMLRSVEPAGITGARLLYGNGMVQHGGVIMGLASLCEHAFRLTRRGDGGPHRVALLDRQVSAVTAACLLIRRTLWDQLGGMDDNFAIALNDVDLCLRAGQAGARIVLAASAELYHYESLSLGRHYEGARAGLEALEVQRLRTLWQSAIAADPFYNPEASLEPGREFQPAFPPRLTPLSWIARRDAAPG